MRLSEVQGQTKPLRLSDVQGQGAGPTRLSDVAKNTPPPVPSPRPLDAEEQAGIRKYLEAHPDAASPGDRQAAAATAAAQQDPRMDQFYVPPVAKDTTGRIIQGFTDWPIETKRALLEASRQGNDALDMVFKGRGMLRKGLGVLEYMSAGFNELLSPGTGFVRSGFGDPIERSAHLPGFSRALGESITDTALIYATPPGIRGAGRASRSVGESKFGEGVKTIFSPTSSEAGKTVSIIERGKAPTTLSQARASEVLIRSRAGEQAMAREQTAAALEGMRKDIAQLPDGAVVVDPATGALSAPQGSKLDFIDAIETGDVARLPPEQRAVAAQLRDMLDHWRDKIQSLGKGYLAAYNENYFPHIWKDPAKAAAAKDLLDAHMASLASKSTLKGRGSFLKQRSIGSTLFGMASRGLEPVTMNPLDLTMMKLWEMQKFYHGHFILEDMKDAGLVKFGRSSGDVPEGFVPLDGREFQIFAPAARAEAKQFTSTTAMSVKTGEEGDIATGIGPQSVGRYWASKPAARILENYLSSGWRGNGLYDGIRRAGNALNQLQLAWPGFHSLFVTNDTMFSELARGVERFAHGEPLRGLKSIAQAPVSLVQTLIKGARVRDAYRFPSTLGTKVGNKIVPHPVQQLADALAAGGGRAKMDEFWRASGPRSFIDAFKEGSGGNIIREMFQGNVGTAATKMAEGARSLGREALHDVKTDIATRPLMALPNLIAKTLDTAAAPIMDWMVPRAKIGVFSNLAEDWLRRNPTHSQMEYKIAMQSIWDSVDNRLGQMVYDNIFWHKSLKDAAFLGTRSVGWNLGTVRELGGSGVDAARAAHDAMTGKSPALTHRMAYAFVLPFGAAVQGAVLTYLFTGHGPQRLMDYFFPPTGGTTPNGGQERISVPSYMKDVVEYNIQPGQTVLNKMHPIFETTQELFKNRDYYGALIADPDTSGSDQLTDYVKYFGGQAEPFSLRSYFRLSKEPGSHVPASASALGINPAPAYITDPERGEAAQRRLDRTARRRKMKENQ